MNCLSDRPLTLLLTLAMFAVPLIIASLWGAPLGDDAYVAFAHGRNLASGRELAPGLTTDGVTSPLYVLLWALLDRLGVPLLPTSVALSGLGWSATALALYGIGRSIGRPLAAVTSAIVVVFNPFVASTLGTEVSWALALFWIAVWLAVRGDWQAQGGVLAWMLWVHFDWLMLAWAMAVLGLQWRQQRRFPRTSALVLAVAASAGLLLAAARALAVPLALPRFSLAGLGALGQLLAESDLYWLSLPVVSLGLLTVRQRAVWVGLLACLLVSTGGGVLGGPCLVVASALLAGLGIDWGAKWLEARALVRPICLAHHTIPLSACLALIALLPLGVAQISSLRQRYQARPYARYEIERQVGSWLSSHGEPGAVLGSAQVGYLAGRPSVLWNGTAGDQAEVSSLIDALNASPPEYCVSTNTIAWKRLTRTGWFQERYELLRRYETAYDARSPFLVWGYRASGFERGQFRPVSASLPQGVHLVRSRHWPERIEPGDAVYVTLYFQSTQAVSSAFEARLRVFSPTDGANWAHQNRIVPYSIPVDWWQPGQTIAERFVLTTTAETPAGAYPLDLSVTGTQVEGLVLGYVSVPWRGTMEGATRVEATFSDEIRLLGFEAPDSGAVGTEILVTLYWEAIRRPDDDYIAFVHLIGPTGQPETSHDGVPMNRRYSTLGWHPGDIVPDPHPLPLKPDMPPGMYTLKVGMYRWPGMERLPARDDEGIEQADQAFALSNVEVR